MYISLEQTIKKKICEKGLFDTLVFLSLKFQEHLLSYFKLVTGNVSYAYWIYCGSRSHKTDI